MADNLNKNQIVRKDARGCFVESLSDAFGIGRIHLAFASYDLDRPAGKRQTDNIHIYIAADEFLELCRKLICGEFRQVMKDRRSSGDRTPLYQCLGGTSAEKLAGLGRSRSDGMSLSRTAQLLCGSRSDFLFVADSGPGQTNEKGLIVLRFGNRPENHVAVSMSFEAFSELMLLTKAHFEAWLAAWYGMGLQNYEERNSSGQMLEKEKLGGKENFEVSGGTGEADRDPIKMF